MSIHDRDTRSNRQRARAQKPRVLVLERSSKTQAERERLLLSTADQAPKDNQAHSKTLAREKPLPASATSTPPHHTERRRERSTVKAVYAPDVVQAGDRHTATTARYDSAKKQHIDDEHKGSAVLFVACIAAIACAIAIVTVLVRPAGTDVALVPPPELGPEVFEPSIVEFAGRPWDQLESNAPDLPVRLVIEETASRTTSAPAILVPASLIANHVPFETPRPPAPPPTAEAEALTADVAVLPRGSNAVGNSAPIVEDPAVTVDGSQAAISGIGAVDLSTAPRQTAERDSSLEAFNEAILALTVSPSEPDMEVVSRNPADDEPVLDANLMPTTLRALPRPPTGVSAPSVESLPSLTVDVAVPTIAGAETLAVRIFAAATAEQSEVDAIQGELLLAGVSSISISRVNYRISADHLRFYDSGTGSPAISLGGRIDVDVRDFTQANVSPPPGTVEVYVAGEATPPASPPVAAQAQPTLRSPPTVLSREQQLRNSILNRLRER